MLDFATMQPKYMGKQELMEALSALPCKVTLHRASHRRKGKEVTWWIAYWARFPRYSEMQDIFEISVRFRNHTQALRHALSAILRAFYVRRKNSSP